MVQSESVGGGGIFCGNFLQLLSAECPAGPHQSSIVSFTQRQESLCCFLSEVFCLCSDQVAYPKFILPF